MKKSILTLLVGACFMGSVMTAQAACTPAHKFSTIEPGVLTVAAWNFPPHSIPVSKTDVSGVDGDIIKAIATKECLRLNVMTVDPAAVIQSIIAGKADVGIGDWYRTVERAKVVNLSAPLYLDTMDIISKNGIDTADGMVGKKIGTIQGYLWNADLQKTYGDKVTLYNGPVPMAQDLASGRIDIGIDASGASNYRQAQGGYKGFKILPLKPDKRIAASIQPGQAGFPYTKGNTALGVALDEDIAALRKSGELGKFLKQYSLPASVNDVGAPRLIQ